MNSESNAMFQVSYTTLHASTTEMLRRFCESRYVEAVIHFARMKGDRERVADVEMFNFIQTQRHLLYPGSKNGGQDIKDGHKGTPGREMLIEISGKEPPVVLAGLHETGGPSREV